MRVGMEGDGMQLVKMPPMPKVRGRFQSGNSGQRELDRIVHWREDDKGDVYGHCARCGERKPAVELRWRPDRVVFGEERQGSWECRECNPRPGKWEVLGVRPK